MDPNRVSYQVNRSYRNIVQARDARLENPFGMRPPCEDSEPGQPVMGYGDPDADVHVIGFHPGRHGGAESGIPFTGTATGRRVREVLAAVGLLADPAADHPAVDNVYLSYLYMCPVAPGDDPSPESIRELDRFFDAELRAVNAHVLIPIGACVTDRVLAAYTTLFEKLPRDMDERHARDVRGRGFLVMPMKDPLQWRSGDEERFVQRLRSLLASDYRQTKGVATLVG